MVGQLIPGLSYEEYCALPGINASLLKAIDKESLLHAKAMVDGRRERESDALDFGHSFHELLLRGREEFVVHPETYAAPKGHPKVKSGEIKEGDPLPWIWSAKVCKEWAAPHDGRVIHSSDEAASLRGMVEAVREQQEIAGFLSGQAEVAAVTERLGQPMKALVDLLPDDPAAPVIDFKKCRSAHPRAFVADCVKHGYHLQAAFYLDVLRGIGQQRKAVWFVAVEDTAPFAISIAKFHDVACSLLRVGRARYRAAMAKWIHAQESGEWPGFESYEAEEYAPGWMKPELENTI